jgi:hypothetical protein
VGSRYFNNTSISYYDEEDDLVDDQEVLEFTKNLRQEIPRATETENTSTRRSC